MAKPVGADCNMACSYCFYRHNRRPFPKTPPRMDRRVLERFIKRYLAAHPGPVVHFAWQGGEPLLAGLDFFELALSLERRHAPPGVMVTNAVQTNGTLIDRDFARFFARNDILVGVSLDGPADCHDAFRRLEGGPSHDRVMAGLFCLQEHGVAYNILCAVHAANQDRPGEVYRFLRETARADFIQFIPIVAAGPRGLCEESVDPAAFGAFLSHVWDLWLARDVGRAFVGHFDAALAARLDQPGGLCAMGGNCGRSLVVERDGSLYACDHFVDAEHRLGNLARQPLPELLDSPVLAEFAARRSATLPAGCRECPVQRACGGGCPKDRVLPDPAGGSPLHYLCAGYRAFLTHADPVLDTMAAAIRKRPDFTRLTA
ncbi:anaerobic sulfatase maturase [Desulfovibrio sulfodismutans]|uniref:Anaerobic sulfatase maturase n=1 Tax=Desulfolutivibrio sulfodismutans TaxID=63561 RepID=A0A7K3NIE1_9BACT|nr:anaerobic sulfatase maturase [Desulfolutivibrio sulfodismutans]NDY55974.1 anaerobic sulfatase maturase [Desulfolutivibrio sulfodismutans]QLA13215.1 anaerobic sulfatase maturase [Desulfolutivibrio sulfodismutans DSM 3696]